MSTANEHVDLDLAELERQVDRDGRAAFRADIEHQLARIQENRQAR